MNETARAHQIRHGSAYCSQTKAQPKRQLDSAKVYESEQRQTDVHLFMTESNADLGFGFGWIGMVLLVRTCACRVKFIQLSFANSIDNAIYIQVESRQHKKE